MRSFLPFDDKSLRFLIQAVDSQIAQLETATADPRRSDDELSDDSNDLGLFRALHAQLSRALEAPDARLQTYECWADSECVALAREDRVQGQREQGLLSAEAHFRYAVHAATYEEAMAIHTLRCGFPPYLPTGEPAPCPRCSAWYFPLGSGQCWQCGLAVDTA